MELVLRLLDREFKRPPQCNCRTRYETQGRYPPCEFLHAGYRILYHEGAVVWHEWCEGSYRKDRIKWYLRLRYMWGRNTAYMVRKHFSDQVGISGYLGAQVNGFVQRRAPQGTAPTTADAKDEEPMPRFFVAMGMFSEFFGIFRGWRDGARARRSDQL